MAIHKSDAGTIDFVKSPVHDEYDSVVDTCADEGGVFDGDNLTDAASYNAPHGPAKSGQRSATGD